MPTATAKTTIEQQADKVALELIQETQFPTDGKFYRKLSAALRTMAMNKKTVISLAFNPFGSQGGHSGCYEAKLKERPGTWGAGRTATGAVESCLRTAASHGVKNLENYAVEVDLDSLPANSEIAPVGTAILMF